MEADLDLNDKLHAADKELSGDNLIIEQYSSQKATNNSTPYNNVLYQSSTNDFKSKTTTDPVLHRPTTPGQFRHSVAAHAVDSLANSLAIGDLYNSHSTGFENIRFADSMAAPIASNHISNNEQKSTNELDRSTPIQKTIPPREVSSSEPPRSNSSASTRSSTSSTHELNNGNTNKKS
jgi:hypothetical protein